jgi:hypothetical protein
MSARTFPDALLQALRGSAIAATLGDTFVPATQLGTIKLEFDYLPPETALPYVVLTQPVEGRQYYTTGSDASRPFLASGLIGLGCWAGDGLSLDTIADEIAKTLSDAPLTWGASRLMYMRLTSSEYVPTPGVGYSSATIFQRNLTFEFMYQGAI